MDRVLRIVDGACAVGAALAAVSCFVLAVMLIVEVIVTSWFAWSQPWAVEYSTYFLGFTLFLGAGWSLRQGGHIRVSAVYVLLPAGVVRVLDLVATVFTLGVVGYAANALVVQAVRTFGIGSVSYYPSATPLWLPQAAIALGFVLFALALAARLLRLLTGRPAEVPGSSAFGPGGVE